MNIVFMGTPDIAANCLQALITAKFNIVACYTQPDKAKGRGKKISMSATKILANKYNITVLQPKSLNSIVAYQALAEMQPDLIVVVAYGLILPQKVLDLPQYGAINVHYSLLPQGRGASPINNSILVGDTETGVTIMQMEAGLDSGPILYQQNCSIDNTDTSATLADKLTAIAAPSLNRVISNISHYITLAKPQNHEQATFCSKISKSDAKINWENPAEVIHRKIRAYNPWPACHTIIANQNIKILAAKVTTTPSNAPPGTIVQLDKKQLLVATSDNTLSIEQLQFPGKKQLPIAEILKSKYEFFKQEKLFT